MNKQYYSFEVEKKFLKLKKMKNLENTKNMWSGTKNVRLAFFIPSFYSLYHLQF